MPSAAIIAGSGRRRMLCARDGQAAHPCRCTPSYCGDRAPISGRVLCLPLRTTHPVLGAGRLARPTWAHVVVLISRCTRPLKRPRRQGALARGSERPKPLGPRHARLKPSHRHEAHVALILIPFSHAAGELRP